MGAAFSRQDCCDSSRVTFVCVSEFPLTHPHTFEWCYQNLMLLPPPVCDCRSGPSVVETGVKAHRATQRSSSPGETSSPHPAPLSVFHSRACLRHLCYPALIHQEEEESLFPRKQVTLSCDFGGRRCRSPPPSLPPHPPMWRITIPSMLLLFSESAAACNSFLYLSV